MLFDSVMPQELIIVGLFVFLYSLVQSLFGVGVLLFGTPTLLLLGYPFDKTLFYLLPCSIAINLMQVVGHWRGITLKRNFILFCLPFVVAGLFILLKFPHPIHIKKYVGVLMIITALIRVSRNLKEMLSKYCRSYLKPSLAIIGILHGFTNMGGGLLSLLVSSLYTEKKKIRSNIAFGYLAMALCQVVVLGFTGHRILGWESVFLVAIALLSFLVAGNKIYLASSEASFQRLLTAFISLFGLTLLLT